MTFDKDKVKEHLDQEKMLDLLEYLGAEPQDYGDKIVCKTICHGGESHKLYYYDEQQLFKCYTNCGDAFDVFELVCKIKEIELNAAINYVVNYFNLQHVIDEVEDLNLSEDWKYFKRCSIIDNIDIEHEKLVLPEIDKNILINFPQPVIEDWENEYISKDICDYLNIRYEPVNGLILIPHYDEFDRLIGIRQRTLVQEDEKYGKYKPARIKGKLRNHPLGWNLYGLNKAKQNITDTGLAIVTESEKGVGQIINYLGTEGNIGVSMCGSSLSNYQFHLLLDLGVKEICICVDADYIEIGDDEYNKIIEKMEKMYNKYSPDCNISFMFDTDKLTGYKMSPTDCGPDIFFNLWNNRKI